MRFKTLFPTQAPKEVTVKSLTLAIALVLSFTLQAGTLPIFTSGDKAHIMIQGPDQDALTLYDNIAAPAQRLRSGLLVKEVVSSTGQIAIICIKTPEDEISCTLTITQVGGNPVRIDPVNRTASIRIWGLAANQLFHEFVKNRDNRDFRLETQDSELIMVSKEDSFSINYQSLN